MNTHSGSSSASFIVDDATISASDSSTSSLSSFLNADLINFHEWCDKNEMKPNIPKTKAMFLSSKQRVNKIMGNPPSIYLAGEKIQLSNTEKLLGIHTDNTFSWASHVEETIKKCNSFLHPLNRTRASEQGLTYTPGQCHRLIHKIVFKI